MREIGSRRRRQPAPPWAVFEDLCDPHRQPARPWLHLLEDEVEPTVVSASRPDQVVWSSLWVKRPDAILRFDLAESGAETDLRWTLYVGQPVPDTAAIAHLRRRVNQLINANLRYTYGQ